MEYVHSPLGEEVQSVIGSYFIEAEEKVKYKDKEVLYLIGGTSALCSCCGGFCQGLRFITVPGFVKAWQNKRGKDDFPISEIEPVREERSKQEIREILRLAHEITNIDFW